jgi:DNA-3-methyladenine glycosylase I
MTGQRRCVWAEGDPLMRAYHDEEWGVPQRDSRMLWEMLMLEGFQAGLAWIIVLRKRPAFRKAFAGLNPKKVARFGTADVARLMGGGRRRIVSSPLSERISAHTSSQATGSSFVRLAATTHAPALTAHEIVNSDHVGRDVGAARIAGIQTRPVNALSIAASIAAASRG